MEQIQQSAKEYAEAGLSVLPTTNDKAGKPKTPALNAWKPLEEAALSPEEVAAIFEGKTVRGRLQLFDTVAGLAVICGSVSGGLELIDVDSKHDPHGTIWEDLCRAIALDDTVAGLFKELYIEQTVSGGYHILYRYEVPEGHRRAGSLELAHAPRKDPKTRGSKIIETRGEGGYSVTAPTPKYETVQGDLRDLPVLTLAERDRLIEICRSLTYEAAPETPAAPGPVLPGRSMDGLSPFEDYNSRATLESVAELMQAHGWTVSGRNAARIFMQRPTAGTEQVSPTSANITLCPGPDGSPAMPLLSAWSSNAEPFEVYKPDGINKKAYRPADVYALLEHAGDYKAARKALYREGYGERRSRTEQLDPEAITVTYENKVNKINPLTDPGIAWMPSSAIFGVETVTLCNPGGPALTREDVKEAPVDVFTIYARERTPEIEAAIYLIHAAKKYAYVHSPDRTGKYDVQRDYKYVAERLIDRYADRDLTDRQLDELRLDIVNTSRRLRIHDRQMFREHCLRCGAADVWITDKQLDATAEELDAADRRENDTKTINTAIRQAAELTAAGKPYEAAKAIQAASKLTDTRADLSALLSPLTEDRLRAAIESQAGDVPCGYRFYMDGKYFELNLPAAALSVIAARTGHRKTSLLMNMAVNIARNEAVQGDVYFLTYEETAADLLLKMMTLDIDTDELTLDWIKEYYRKGSPEGKFRTTEKTAETFREKKDRFFSELIQPGRLRVLYPGLPAPELCSMIRQLTQEGKVAAVFIDYIQQLRIPEQATQSRQVQLQEICELLRETATATGLPLILGAQFNRTADMEGTIESAKIREAGDIEQTANLILGLWDRRQTQHNHTDRQGKAAKKEDGKLYVEILKGRGIGTGADAVLEYKAKTWKIMKN